jgi:hypothetical protein
MLDRTSYYTAYLRLKSSPISKRRENYDHEDEEAKNSILYALCASLWQDYDCRRLRLQSVEV